MSSWTTERLRMPAVSTMRKGTPSRSTTMSTASRVVPATSLTMERVRPAMRLTSDDLPTLGRPMMAMLTVPSG